MQLFYQKIGTGEKILLAFHGVGQDFSCFMPLAHTVAQEYTTYLFDLPFHGRNGEQPLSSCTKDAWLQFLNDFLVKNHIQRFSLIGFSIGAKMVLCSYERFASRIDKVFLLAPDGIQIHPVYTFATQTLLGQKLFRWLLAHASFLLKSGEVLQKMALLPAANYGLMVKLLSTASKRQQLYNIWMGMSHFRVETNSIAHFVRQFRTHIYCFVGLKDEIIPPRCVKKLTRHLPPENTIELTASHHQVVAQTLEYILQAPAIFA